VRTSGHWQERRLRGTATRYLVSESPGARLRVPFAGRAVSVLLPTDFIPPGPRYGTLGGELRARIDGGAWREVPCDRGREVLVADGLSAAPHVVEIECSGVEAGPAGVEAVRAWDASPTTVSGRIEGGELLTDLRADVSGPVSFSRTVRNARTGAFSLLLPTPGAYEIDLCAAGWTRRRLRVEAPGPGRTVRLPDVALALAPSPAPPTRPLAADEPLVLICFAHANIWGQESAEWLARRVGWINGHQPHAVLDANEVNPVYVAGAFRELACPWLTCSGNHSMPGFDEHLAAGNRGLAVGPACIVSAGRDVVDEPSWRRVLEQFAERDRLRIVCSYEPDAPPELLLQHRVRFLFFGHSPGNGCWWEDGGTTFLRKVDANTFYRVEIGPPHDAAAPVRIERFVFPREAPQATAQVG